MKKIKLLLAAMAAMVGLGVNAQTWTGSAPAEGTFFLYNVGAGKFINVGDKSAGWGTNAYLTPEYGLDLIFEANNGAYNLNTRVCNGGSSRYLNTALWCDQGATPWTFTKVERNDINAYTISNGSSYIVANAAGTDIEYTALSNTERDQWQIIGRSDILNNLNANTAAGVNRTVATFFISDPDFGRNDERRPNWNYNSSGGNVTVPGFSVDQGSANNYGCEFWNNTFDIHQELTNLPDGIYEFEIYGMATNGTTYIYATTTEGTTEKLFKNTSANGKNFQGVLNAIDEFGGNATGLFQVTDGKLTIGVKRETNSNQDWAVIDQARLYYYGDYTFAEAYGADLNALITTAQALVDAAPFAALASDLSGAITTAEGVMSSGTTEEDFATGQSNLQNAIDAYNAQLTLVDSYITLRASVVAGRDDTSIYTDGGSYTSSLNSVLSTQDAAAVAATTAEDVTACVTTLKTAYITFVTSVTVNSGKYFDLTNVLITNPTVSQNTTGWTIDYPDGYPNDSYSHGTVNYGETEFYQQNFDFYQSLTLPRGTWEFGVTGFHRGGQGDYSTYFYAGDDDQVLIPGVASNIVNSMDGAKTYFDNGNGMVSLKFALEEENNTLKVGIKNTDTATDKWTIFRNFTLKFYGSAIDYSSYSDAWDAAVTAANAAITTYPTVTTGSEYVALSTALANVPTGTSKADYITKTNALTSATANFISAAPYFVALANEIVKANALGFDGSMYAATSSTTAAEALTNTQNLMVNEYTFVSTTYSYAVNLGTWNQSDNAGSSTGQHWDGTNTSSYLEQGSGDLAYNLSSWTVTYDQNLTLPAGNYVFKVAGRTAATDVTLTLNVTNIATSDVLGTVNDFPKGDTGYGINKNGVTSFDASDAAGFARNGSGGGWQWRYVKFTLAEPATVQVAVIANATAQYRWMSFCNATVQTDDENNVTLISDLVAYNSALLAAQNARDNATYTNVDGKEKADLLAAIAADGSLDKTSTSAVEAATTALTDATTAFTAADAVTNYGNLVSAIASAQAIVDADINVGSGVFQIPTSAQTTLSDAIATASSTKSNAATTATDAATATNALNDAVTTYNNAELNAPADGKKYYIKVATTGHAKLGNAWLLTAGSTTANNPTGYTIQANKAPAAYLSSQAWTLTQVSGNSYKISLDLNGTTVYLTNGTANNSPVSWKASQIQGTTDESKAMAFTIAAADVDNTFYIYNTETNSTIACQSGGNIYTEAGNAYFSVEEVSQATVEVSVKAGKLATRIFPFKPTLPEGVVAYSCAESTSTSLTLVEVAEPAANVPYILYSEAGCSSTDLTGWGSATADTYTEGLLTGVFARTEVPEGSYVLQTQSGTQAFYKVSQTGAYSSPYRVYVTVPSSDVKAFSFTLDDIETAIEAARAEGENTVTLRYNAAGQQMQNAQKGLNIIKMADGSVRKVLVK